MRYGAAQKGASLIDLVLSIAIVSLLFGGVYMVYFSIESAIANVSVRTAASTVLGAQIETIRNLPYDSVGTVGGVPAGILSQTQTVTSGNFTFVIQTTVRNIDDPFDGTLGGTPNDTAPNDYKLVWVQASCPLCMNFIPISITTTVAPKNLESATQDGSLFIYALNANGVGVPGATVHVVNASVTPSIDLTDTTNASGVLELVGVPTSTQRYWISVTKAGYSTDQTYPPGGSGNPNPSKPNATIVAETVTSVSFSIDQLSSLAVSVTNDQCAPIGGKTLTMQGTKIIGTTPNVLKFSTSSVLNASGTLAMQNVEWDTYILGLNAPAYDIAGTIPFNPITVNPSSTQAFQFILQSVSDPALLATITDAGTGGGIANAQVTLSKSGFSKTLSTDHATFSQSDWSNGAFSSGGIGLDPSSVPGEVGLLASPSSTYATSSASWLISNTFDVGGTASTFNTLSWTGTAPVQTGSGSVAFQVAANNDNASWSFIGPDGTAGTYFTAPTTGLPASLSGDRYFRYKLLLNTQDQNYSPEVTGVSVDFTANCVPPAQALFQGLPQGTYTLDATASGYAENSTTVSVAAGYQSSTLSLTHL